MVMNREIGENGETERTEEMKWLYLECYSGISGDMTVGALLDLGASEKRLKEALDSLGVDGYQLHFGRTKKCGIDAFDFDVHLEEDSDREYEYDRDCTHSQDAAHSQDAVHGHAHHHHHSHPHDHTHRNIQDVFAVIDRLKEEEKVKLLAKKMFTIVAEAESKAHGIPVEEVHFHEVGAIDSIVDIIGAAVCFVDLGVSHVAVSSLSEGRGHVRCQHGIMPVPVPATVNIAAAYSLNLHLTEQEGEMVTPTGAAIAAALKTEECLPEHYCIEGIGLGAGKKDFQAANILRAMLLKPVKKTQNAGQEQHQEELWMLETNLDDCTGEAMGYALERLLEEGARDAWYTAACMKKNRPAYVLHALCDEEKADRLESLIFAHTTTIGIRRYPVKRRALKRYSGEVETRYGTARVKYCVHEGRTYIYPEYESVKQICRNQDLAFTEVYHEIKENGKMEADRR